MTTALMKAIVYDAYGGPDVLRLRDLPRPAPGSDDLLIRVRAASLNAGDRHLMRGTPYVFRLQAGTRRPKGRLGMDLAGEVIEVGANVTRFTPGDAVFGCPGGALGGGTLAEYVTVPQDAALAPKPAEVSYTEAAAVPLAGLTALQTLRDKGRVTTGRKVLVNGAAGGVGTFAVQIARGLGAEVTGVCGPGNVKLVRSLGAEHVVDHTAADFTRTGPYDLILDNVGNRSLADLRRALVPGGAYILNSGSGGRWFGPLGRLAGAFAVSAVTRERVLNHTTRHDSADLAHLAELMEAGTLTPVIGRTHPLSETAEAFEHLETGHATGKVVITLG